MASPTSPYGDVELRHAKAALRGAPGVELAEELSEQGDGCLVIKRDGKTGVVDVAQNWCSGGSMEHCCYRVGLDPIDVYNDIIKAESKTERTK